MSNTVEKVFVFFGFLNAVTAITAVIGNSLVIHALQRNRSLHRPYKALLCCLALSDLGIGLFVQPVSAMKAFETELNILPYLGVMDDNRILRLPTFMLIFVSVWTLTTIAVDRFLALHLHQRYRVVVTMKRLVPLLVSYWIVGALIVALWLLKGKSPLLMLIFSLAVSLVCILISSFVFTKCLLKLRHYQMQVQCQAGENSNGSRLNMARYKKSVESMTCVYIIFLVSYIPYCCVAGVAITYENGTSRYLMRFVSSTILYINSTLNPLVYCWRIREIRQIVRHSFSFFLCK